MSAASQAQQSRAQADDHAALVGSVGPCLRFLRIEENGRSEKNHMAYSITKKEIAPQPVLMVRRRVKPSEVAATLAEVLGNVFLVCAT